VFATVPPPPQRLLVFARLPEKGKVKTRLAAAIGEERALAVYEAMLRDVIASITQTTSEPAPETEIEFLWPPTPGANGAALRRAFAHHAVAMQTGADLSDRLSMAFSERFYFHHTEKIVAIGVDDPTLPRTLIDHAFALLDSVEWIAGPAADGGYYLIGCRGASFDPAVFQNIEWGSSRVLTETLAKIRDIGQSVALLPERYDIDTVSDLERFAADAHDTELGRLVAELLGS
jgi:rSAM/selenodomain-associated transferase 1